MLAGCIPLRRKYFALTLSSLGLLLSVLLVFSTTVRAGPGSNSGQQYTVFDAPNAIYTYAASINDLGTVTGYFFDASRRMHGFVREEDGRIIVIDATPDATGTQPVGTNLRGETAGISEAGSFIRNRHGDITFFNAPDSIWTNASGINDRGEVAGVFADKATESLHGFVRDVRGDITAFDPPNGYYTRVSGINFKGDIVGIFLDASQAAKQRIYVRDWKGNFTIIDLPNGTPWVAGMNDRGDIAGYYVANQQVFGFLRERSGVLVPLDLSGPGVTGVNDRGEVVGIFADPSRGGKICGFVWEPRGGVTVLDAPNATATYAYSINNRGEVSGGFDVAGLGSQRRGFVFRMDWKPGK